MSQDEVTFWQQADWSRVAAELERIPVCQARRLSLSDAGNLACTSSIASLHTKWRGIQLAVRVTDFTLMGATLLTTSSSAAQTVVNAIAARRFAGVTRAASVYLPAFSISDCPDTSPFFPLEKYHSRLLALLLATVLKVVRSLPGVKLGPTSWI